MIGSNPIFSTELHIGAEKPLFHEKSAKSLPQTSNSGALLPFTLPILRIGKSPSRVPQGVSKYEVLRMSTIHIWSEFFLTLLFGTGKKDDSDNH